MGWGGERISKTMTVRDRRRRRKRRNRIIRGQRRSKGEKMEEEDMKMMR